MKPALYIIPILAITVSWLIWARFRNRWGHIYVAKPLSTLLVIAAALLSLREPTWSPVYTTGITVGLVLSLGGDVALMFPEKPRAFLVGLVLFLLAHVAYTALFLSLGRFSSWDVLTAALLILAAAGFYQLIQTGLGPLKGPVIAYMAVLSLMVHRALSAFVSPAFAPGQAWMVASGAILFYLSDVVLAADRFWRPLKYHPLSLALYYGGQLLLALAASYF
ncbi:MAG: lysoplasmalogenase [Thermoflexia bacterium]|nr:MAG: lysoplasmalogenase [Thermoflexia bacterium]